MIIFLLILVVLILLLGPDTVLGMILGLISFICAAAVFLTVIFTIIYAFSL
jgi:hypothetical protein